MTPATGPDSIIRTGIWMAVSKDITPPPDCMGGTTAKASLTRNGDAEITSHYFIGGYNSGHPVMLPVVDIVEVGSGGGSIAWLDAAGGLKVGPVSAGAMPGPACYGRGGTLRARMRLYRY